MNLKEKGFYGFKKKLLKKKYPLFIGINELEWEDFSYE